MFLIQTTSVDIQRRPEMSLKRPTGGVQLNERRSFTKRKRVLTRSRKKHTYTSIVYISCSHFCLASIIRRISIIVFVISQWVYTCFGYIRRTRGIETSSNDSEVARKKYDIINFRDCRQTRTGNNYYRGEIDTSRPITTQFSRRKPSTWTRRGSNSSHHHVKRTYGHKIRNGANGKYD